MSWLIWKDYRLNRVIVLVGIGLVAVPHVLAAILAWRGVGALESGVAVLSGNLFISGLYSVVLSQLTLTLVGGNAIACERADRSAEFLAYLPVSRAKILASKLIVALGVAALAWIPNLVILTIASAGVSASAVQHAVGARQAFVFFGWDTLGTIAVGGLASCCVAWLFSSVLESPTFSVCAGLMTPPLVLASAAWLFRLLGFPRSSLFWWFCLTCLALSAASFAGGTLYYLRRREP
jgi:ABC-type transport system involved in multi-copper enzyme maturation permease subunit